jgi:hypothetical protein
VEECAETRRVLDEGEGASAALCRKRRGRGRRALSVEVKIDLAIPLGFIDPWSHAPRIARSACINGKRTTYSLTGDTHHDWIGQAHTRARSLRRNNRRAVAGCHVRPPTSPTMRAATAPQKARPHCRYLTLTGCDYRPGDSKPAQRERVPQVTSIYKNY